MLAADGTREFDRNDFLCVTRTWPVAIFTPLHYYGGPRGVTVRGGESSVREGPVRNGAYLRGFWDDFSRPAAGRPRDRLEQLLLAECPHYLDERFEAAMVCERFGLRG